MTTMLPESDSSTLDEISRHLDNLEEIIRRLEHSTAFVGTLWDTLTGPQRAEINAITASVATALAMPASSVIVFLDDGESKPLAHCGEGDPEGKVNDSFCVYTVMSESDFIVNEARKNKYVKRNPRVRDGSIQSYAGTPVWVHGRVAGSMCAYGPEPREWSEADMAVLHQCAAAVGHVLED